MNAADRCVGSSRASARFCRGELAVGGRASEVQRDGRGGRIMPGGPRSCVAPDTARDRLRCRYLGESRRPGMATKIALALPWAACTVFAGISGNSPRTWTAHGIHHQRPQSARPRGSWLLAAGSFSELSVLAAQSAQSGAFTSPAAPEVLVSRADPLLLNPLRSRRALYYSCSARKVSQLPTLPAFKPVMNQRERCAEVPWVNASGTT